VITTPSLPDATLGALYSTPLSASGGGVTHHWRKIGLLPRGLRLTGAGILTGIPNPRMLGPGMYAITVEVLSKTRGYPIQTATEVLTLTIS
jgi:hypothetical protein